MAAIKKLSSDDWEKFQAIRLAGIASDPQAFGDGTEQEVERKEPEWRKRLEASDKFYFAVEEGGILLAVAGAKKVEDRMWMLVAVHTLPQSRGMGFAQALIGQVIQESQSRGATTMQLMVNIDQKNAVHIYEKMGFQIVKTLKAEKMADGKLHDDYVMEKELMGGIK